MNIGAIEDTGNKYIRMEFCDGGDLEDFIGLQKNKILPLESVAIPFFFQMVFGLYCARDKFNLRHCDIKLLNFFLKDIGRANPSKTPGAADIVLNYLLEDSCFVLRMPASFSYYVKLADYGSADSNPDNLGKPVTIDQFATLENSPVEFLLEGDAAEQSYAADTFSLGLCLLHLFTGSAPYEELLDAVHCPAELLKDLKFLWTDSL
uniref:Protein kinase domain-containing protein n=1 Tax=Phytophthora ramorum TaxID=164328 RepID=H3HCD1_PHYRM